MFTTEDHFFMQEALVEATKGGNADEVPVGAVLVHKGAVIAQAHNQIEKQQDPTAHAELLCVRQGALIVQNWRLNGVTLYTTLEPCSMCLGALFLSRVDRVVFGAKDLRHGACGSWVDLLKKKHPTHQLQVEGGLLEKESAHLMRTFFQKRRLGSGH